MARAVLLWHKAGDGREAENLAEALRSAGLITRLLAQTGEDRPRRGTDAH